MPELLMQDVGCDCLLWHWKVCVGFGFYSSRNRTQLFGITALVHNGTPTLPAKPVQAGCASMHHAAAS